MRLVLVCDRGEPRKGRARTGVPGRGLGRRGPSRPARFCVGAARTGWPRDGDHEPSSCGTISRHGRGHLLVPLPRNSVTIGVSPPRAPSSGSIDRLTITCDHLHHARADRLLPRLAHFLERCVPGYLGVTARFVCRYQTGCVERNGSPPVTRVVRPRPDHILSAPAARGLHGDRQAASHLDSDVGSPWESTAIVVGRIATRPPNNCLFASCLIEVSGGGTPASSSYLFQGPKHLS